jgi:outer membrane protein TolC
MIFLMLFASIIESFYLLPSHMTLFPGKKDQTPKKKWITKWEDTYASFLNKTLPKRYIILAFFIALLVGTGILVKHKFSFVMFPRSESREIVLSGIASRASTPEQTSVEIQPIEDFLSQYIGKEGIGTRTRIALGRRGDAAVENQFQITLEILPADKRDRSSQDIVDEIKTFTDTQEHIEKLRIRRSRFGQTSGSAFEILIQENDDTQRDLLSAKLRKALEEHPDVGNIEADFIPTKKEYSLNYNQAELKRLSVNPASVAQTLRTILNGSRLYTLFRNDDEIDVNLTVQEPLRKSIETVLRIPVENVQGYLVPLEDVVSVTPIQAKKTIRRFDEKRTSFLYADVAKESGRSPLDIADELENTVFPDILADFPNAQLKFDGEIVDTRESRRDLINGILFSIGLIYLVLAILFDSVTKPLRILLVVPFGIIGVILAFYAHDKTQFGFYAAIGTLGMLGVVVNDAIVMLNKLDQQECDTKDPISFTSSVAKTRLRAIILTTLTTVAGVMPTAYGFGGTDTMLSDMMIAMAWGLLFGSTITLILIPCVYLVEQDFRKFISRLAKPKLSTWLLLGLLFVASPTYAKTISLNDFLTQASQNDTTFHAILAQKQQLAFDQDRNVTSPELTLGLDSSLGVDTSDSTSTLTLSQTLPKFGQTFSLSSTEAQASGVKSNSTSFSFSQDIAQNAFGKQQALSSSLQHIKTDISRFQLIEAYEDYFAELTKLYYTWIRQYESLKLARSSYKENKKVLDSIKSRKRKKIADETDVNKLQLQTIAKEENIIRFKSNVYDTTQKIKRALNITDNATLFPNLNVTIDPLESLDTALTTFETQSRTMALLDKLAEEDKTATQIAARNLLPSITFSSTLTQDDETSGYVGATVAFPIFRSQAKATFEAAKIEEIETEASVATTKSTLLAQLHAIHNSLKSQNTLIELATTKRRLAYSILQEESENYSYGKINLNDYIVAVNQYDQARFDEIDRKITYQQLITEWKRLTDQLVKTL